MQGLRREVSATALKDFARQGGLSRAEHMNDNAAQKNSS
jgi:hypothetical protein